MQLKGSTVNGTAPIDVSSGDQVRHRLSRAGNRRVNHALHMMAVTQIRYPATPGRLYYERKRTEGKTPKEALRCLKPRLSDLVVIPAPRGPAGHNRSVRITYDPAAHAVYIHLTGDPLTPGRTTLQAPHRPTLAGSSRSTGKTAASSASRSSTPAPASTTTS
jgi:transposase